MASVKKTLAVVFLLLTLFEASLCTVHKVGDAVGWTMMGGVNYNKWASSKNFHIGDSLLFQYDEFHNVLEVTEQDFESCHTKSPLATYESESDSINITLKAAGRYYFLCGVPGHCEIGMRFEVLVTPATFLRPTASPATAPHASAPAPAPAPHALAVPSGSPIDGVPPSSAKSSAPFRNLPLLLLAINVIVFYVSILA